MQQRITAMETELQLLKRRVAMPTPSKEEIKKRIREYRSLVKEISKSLKVGEDPDTYIAKLRAKEY
ncbi:MAG: hypothetical protein HY929_04980 [Euryarchaeota archaeon]|nr:hypothetical protein [Euryarchaeota archaeon]